MEAMSATDRRNRHDTPLCRRHAAALLAEGKSPDDPDATVPIPGAKSNEAELEFWNEVKDSDDPEEIQLYIEQFPRGEFVDMARRRMAELGAKKT